MFMSHHTDIMIGQVQDVPEKLCLDPDYLWHMNAKHTISMGFTHGY
ncbi:hypothetical protein KK083_25805 [Fulvivirgaceae bacterium PWU4]|uniref:Uncharacterized protein n=1 Tax=Chryseosolibacter histidini TaxID=2782349 RepID=A0AAP2GQN8_9BACT|nr:hypothetical protein [Chryseosolibacter histidini]MBT1700328.1 hypothetical protein [Chryseosolibacter histidini]